MDKVSSCNTSAENFNQYTKEWNNYFHENHWIEKLKTRGVKGQLRNSCFRSICWKVFLECFPENPSEWADAANAMRQKYEYTLDKLQINPWGSTVDLDLHMNHPLSQSAKSPWYNYFQDSELKLSIQQDVVRTFPEINFFRSAKVQSMMINILFCYAKEYPNIRYRQGMHELLAPIIYVLHMDQENYIKVTETEFVPLDISILLNQNYTEHDAFFLFCQLMEAVEGWYVMPETYTKCRSHLIREPFTRPLDSTQSNTLGIKLTKIHENHLQRHDPQLYVHLDQMEIAPQIYGIRWMRLLFGREFVLPDLLVVWDAIFATSVSFDLVEYIFTAMLINVRDLLLESDYTSCLRILMHYPAVKNVNYIIDLALHLKDPAVYCKSTGLYFDPQSCSYKTSSNSSDLSQYEPKLKAATSPPEFLTLKNPSSGSVKEFVHEALEVLETDISVCSAVSEKHEKGSDACARNNEYSKKQLRSFILNGGPEIGSMPLKNKKGWYNFRRNNKTCDDSKNFSVKEMVLIKETLDSKSNTNYSDMMDISAIKDNVDIHGSMTMHQLKSMNKFCFEQMTLHLKKLRHSLYVEETLSKGVINDSLDGLEEVRDILKKTVQLNCDYSLDAANKLQDSSNVTVNANSITEEKTDPIQIKILNTCSHFNVNNELGSNNVEII